MASRRIKTCKILSAIVVIIIFFSILLAYFKYLTLKKTFISEISHKVSSLIGQRVKIEDFSFSPPARVNIHGVVIENPEGFEEGRLLKVKRVSLLMKYGELLKGRISFKTIEVDTPELTVIKDKNNRLNISEAFRSFLSKKAAIRYQIDTLEIHSGVFDVYGDQRYRSSNITLTFNHLSSKPGTKTLVKASGSTLGKSRISVEGWAYLSDDPKRFGLSASLEDMDFSMFRELLGEDKFDTGKAKIDASLHAEGDTRRGLTLKSKIQMKSARFILFDKGRKDITLNADTFLDIGHNSLIIEKALLTAGAMSAVQLTGEIKDITGNPSYLAQLKVNVLDLSAFNLIKGLKAGGVMTSDTISIRGKLAKAMPALSGSLQLRNVSLKSLNAHVESINAKITLSSERGLSAGVEGSATILKAGKYVFSVPAEVRGTMDVRGKPSSLTIVSSVELFPIQVSIEKGKNLQVEKIHALIQGNLRGGAFSGKSSAEFRGIRYADYIIERCNSTMALGYLGNIITLRNPEIKSEKFQISAGAMKIALPERKGTLLVEAKDLNGSLAEKKVEIRQMDCSLNLLAFGEDISGNITFSNGKIFFRDQSSGVISGEGKFDKNLFSLDMRGAELFKGAVRLSVKGKTSGGPFPMTVAVTAEKTDMFSLSMAASGFIETPYRFSGELTNVSFNGTLESMNSISGSASLHAERLSVINAEINKTIIKDAVLNSDAAFRGKDISFKADASAGKLSATLSGTVNGFMDRDRAVKIKAVLPETRAADIRNAFWDIVPDKFLYIGLEGSLAADIAIGFGKSSLSAEGELRVKDLLLEGENGEYSAGPVNGLFPVHYNKAADSGEPLQLPSFERAEFQNLSEYYAKKHVENGFSKITIGSLRYGFKLLEDIEIRVSQSGKYLNVGHVSANIFEGRLDGSAVFVLSDGLNYRAGMIVKGISLTRLCDDIAPIKGYVAGKVDGVALLKGSGEGMHGLVGRADFWAYSERDEKTKISKEFLRTMGGPSMKAYINDRPFDKGIISLYLENGFLIFRELEISHRNLLGITDLSVKVVPLNNRIAVDHLMSTIAEAAERAKKK